MYRLFEKNIPHQTGKKYRFVHKTVRPGPMGGTGGSRWPESCPTWRPPPSGTSPFRSESFLTTPRRHKPCWLGKACWLGKGGWLGLEGGWWCEMPRSWERPWPRPSTPAKPSRHASVAVGWGPWFHGFLSLKCHESLMQYWCIYFNTNICPGSQVLSCHYWEKRLIYLPSNSFAQQQSTIRFFLVCTFQLSQNTWTSSPSQNSFWGIAKMLNWIQSSQICYIYFHSNFIFACYRTSRKCSLSSMRP